VRTFAAVARGAGRQMIAAAAGTGRRQPHAVRDRMPAALALEDPLEDAQPDTVQQLEVATARRARLMPGGVLHRRGDGRTGGFGERVHPRQVVREHDLHHVRGVRRTDEPRREAHEPLPVRGDVSHPHHPLVEAHRGGLD
jgi:hypothetical protein